MSAIDTAEFRKLTLLAAGIDPSEIPPILDTAEWRRLLIVAIENATAGGGTSGVASISVNGGTSQTGSVALTIPGAHKTQHSIGGADVLTPANIGAVENVSGVSKIQRVTSMPGSPDANTLYIVIP
jgi:hypothetical protein